ncbi:MAG: helix-turn-helix transcriptional regulator [Clostridiales bacterium]|nr:helix-turn-helix transcriptional regulator [Clostridiales bacterium]
MKTFPSILSELIKEKSITKSALSKELGLSSSSVISAWALGKKMPSLENAIKLANYFDLSLDYLFGFKEIDDKNTKYKQVSTFNERLKSYMNNEKISQNQMTKNGEFYFANFNQWFYKNSDPDMSTVIKLAKYLKVSLDYLAGRD